MGSCRNLAIRPGGRAVTRTGQGDPNGASLGCSAILPKLDVVKASAYYLRKNMKSGFGDAFRLDERSLLAASLALQDGGAAYFRADFRRVVGVTAGETQIRQWTASRRFASFFEF